MDKHVCIMKEVFELMEWLDWNGISNGIKNSNGPNGPPWPCSHFHTFSDHRTNGKMKQPRKKNQHSMLMDMILNFMWRLIFRANTNMLGEFMDRSLRSWPGVPGPFIILSIMSYCQGCCFLTFMSKAWFSRSLGRHAHPKLTLMLCLFVFELWSFLVELWTNFLPKFWNTFISLQSNCLDIA